MIIRLLASSRWCSCDGDEHRLSWSISPASDSWSPGEPPNLGPRPSEGGDHSFSKPPLSPASSEGGVWSERPRNEGFASYHLLQMMSGLKRGSLKASNPGGRAATPGAALCWCSPAPLAPGGLLALYGVGKWWPPGSSWYPSDYPQLVNLFTLASSSHTYVHIMTLWNTSSSTHIGQIYCCIDSMGLILSNCLFLNHRLIRRN